MELVDLPPEILDTVIYHLDSHANVYALSRTCRALYFATAATKLPFHPNFRRDRYTLPRDHRFITNIVTQLADWAVESQHHSDELEKAIGDGLDGLLVLATEVAWVTLAEIKEAACAKDEIHELFLKIDEYEAKEGRSTLIDGAGMRFGLSNPYDRALGYIIYCALFHHEVDAMLKYGGMLEDLPHLSGHLRLQYVEHCMPQKATWRFSSARLAPIHFDWHTCHRSHLSRHELSLTLLSFLYGKKIIVGDHAALHRPAPVSEAKRRIFFEVCLHLGWPTLCMLLPSGSKTYEEKLRAIRLQVLESDYVIGHLPRRRSETDSAWGGFRRDVDLAGPFRRNFADRLFGNLTFFR